MRWWHLSFRSDTRNMWMETICASTNSREMRKYKVSSGQQMDYYAVELRRVNSVKKENQVGELDSIFLP